VYDLGGEGVKPKKRAVMLRHSKHERGEYGSLVKYSHRMNQYFVYILLCSDNSYYTGVTNDIERRFYEHENGLNPDSYTHKRRPVKLVSCERFTEIEQAIAFEKQIKGWNRKKKEALINGEWELLPGLSKRHT
jgi:putative endonuclease